MPDTDDSTAEYSTADAVIVTDSGFHADSFAGRFDSPGTPGARAWDLPSDTDPATLPAPNGVRLIRIAFPNFADGRGFSIAAALRRAGYGGRLRAVGHVLADQYAMARRAGFDEVEIDAALAARQPQPHWQARADWQAQDHRARLRTAPRHSG